METPTLTTASLNGRAAGTSHAPFRTAAVLGAGVMGSQIAAHLANAGLSVHLLDVTPESIGREGKPNDIVESAWKDAQKLNPDPFMGEAPKRRVTLGNFDEHFDRVKEADWIIEVVVERLDVKQKLMERLEKTARESAVFSTNTSGLPISQIAEGRSDSFKSRFLGTHFFNPPRYLKLFEMIPTADTDPEVVARVAHFARVHLGKGVVVAKDTPNFIGNRIGIYAMMGAIEQFTSGDFSIEEIDALTGTLIGHPKSATFRTADVVGLDTLKHVTENLYEGVPDDESRDRFEVPPVLANLVESKRLGQKTRAGFYKKEGDTIKSVDPESMEYRDPKDVDFDSGKFKKAGKLPQRLAALWEDDGRAGTFFRETTRDLLAYSARRIPEIADSPADIDKAIKWGFGWEMGPFETWDALGFQTVLEDLRGAGLELPDWVDNVPEDGLYRDSDGEKEVWVPAEGRYVGDPRPADEISLTVVKRDDQKTLWSNSDAALLDIGDGVALFEFRSKSNSLGQELMSGLSEAIDKVENDPDLRGMVIGNEGANFSVGANLGEVVMAVMMDAFDQIGEFIEQFQNVILKVRYASKPVVVAAHQRVLGGGAEITMAAPYSVAAAETYMGLVELGVGVIPAGTGTTHMAWWASEQAANRDRPSEIQPFLRQAFEQIAMAKVATSAPMAREMGYLSPNSIIVMNDARRFHVAKEEVRRLSEQGYLPPPVRDKITVLGRSARALFDVALAQFRDGDFISDYDQYLAGKLAYVMTGGDITAPTEVHEQYLLELEREVFLSLLGEKKTQARIESILTTNKPLRN
ncbi:3-hydroxyacyl-CoA dehydrogenase/enoyl-CoA hydratase family protein [soil metagenome]